MGKVDACVFVPDVDGKPSKLYIELSDRIKNRPLTNLIYASYLQEGVAEKMSDMGHTLNKQGQHSGTSVMQFFGVNQMKINIDKISSLAKSIGTMDNKGNLIDFTNAEEALQIASQANSKSKGTISFVVQHSDIFNVLTMGKDANTHMRALEVDKNLSTWNIIKQAFSNIGININDFDFNRTLINANNGRVFLDWLENIRVTRNDLFTEKEIKTLLMFNKDSTQVIRLEHMFGSIDDAANKIYDAFHNKQGQYTSTQYSLMNSTINACKKILDKLPSLVQQVKQTEGDIEEASPSIGIDKTLKEFTSPGTPKRTVIHRKAQDVDDVIRSLLDATSDALFVLKRELRDLEKLEETTEETKKLRSTVETLTKEIANKRYSIGVLYFLDHALNRVSAIETLIEEAEKTPGTNLERSMKRAEALMKIKEIVNAYGPIIEALSNIDKLMIDESITKETINSIKDQANQVAKIFKDYRVNIANMKQETMIDLATEYLGNEDFNGISIADIVTMGNMDSTTMDHLYSINRVTNPLITTMGEIIKNAQDERTRKLVDISIRIRRATNKLYKAGYDSSFMYEYDNLHIISDINWYKYNRDRIKYSKSVNYDTDSIKLWEEENTEERVMDFETGRTERVPNHKYRKAFPILSKEQQEYYNTMMQIKGEIGTLLPKYAQRQYIPPQKRRSFWDAMVASKGNPKKMARVILNKIKDKFVIREDDTMFAQNGLLSGYSNNNFSYSLGDLDNTPMRQIPIFYIKELDDANELLKDFSSAIQALAATAINYDCMNRIKDTIEFIGDYIKSKNPPAIKDKKRLVDRLHHSGVSIVKDLVTFSKNTKTIGLVEGFIDQHIYGVKIKNVTKWTKLAQLLINYTSVRSLSANVKGFVSNVLIGEVQMMIEAGAGEFYNSWDYIRATGLLFKDDLWDASGRVIDYFSNNVNSMAVLFAQKFDPNMDVVNDLAAERYFQGKSRALRHMLNKDFTFIGYGMGEHLLHFTNMYAVLLHTKVKIDGKESSLFNAFYKGNKIDGTSELLLKDNVTYKDKNGNWVPVDDAYLDWVKNRIKYCNQTTHGAMNEEDKGLIHQRMMGRFIMNLRQWMVEHYSRRFRSRHRDAVLGEEREGYYYTVGKFLKSWCKAIFRFNLEYATRWKDLTKEQKANCKRAMREHAILGCLLALSFALGEPDDHKKDWWMRMWIYLTKRAIMEVSGSTPIGVIKESTNIVNSPVPSVNTVNSYLYIFYGLGDIDEKVTKGRYKGWNRYGYNVLKYDVPFYSQVDQLIHLDEEDESFKLFNRGTIK